MNFKGVLEKHGVFSFILGHLFEMLLMKCAFIKQLCMASHLFPIRIAYFLQKHGVNSLNQLIKAKMLRMQNYDMEGQLICNGG